MTLARTLQLTHHASRITCVRLLLLCWSLTFCLPSRSAQPAFLTLLTNGPAANRLNLVVISEGYTTNDLARFPADASAAVGNLLSRAPFTEYRSYCNAFAIAVSSVQSGSDHPSDGPSGLRDTYFNSTYDDSDLIITIPPNWRDSNPAHGQGKVDALLQTFLPNCGLSILLVNDLVSGGSDGFGKTAIASTGFSSPDILAHETGHVLAGLGDEYSTPYPGFPDTEEPNTTRETRRDFIKWKAWIDGNTPIPTPSQAAYSGVIGLFEGAHYQASGWYRPKLSCAMRENNVPFCEICQEALVLALYQKVRLVDSFVPAETNLSVTTAQPVVFDLQLLQPATHGLDTQWFLDGAPLPGANHPTLTLLPFALNNGSHRLSVVVKDNTPLVRTDPTNLLTQTIAWALDVAVPRLRLDDPSFTGGRFYFRVTGTAPRGVAIQSSADLQNWNTVTTNSLVNGQFWYTNAVPSGSLPRFFRAMAQ